MGILFREAYINIFKQKELIDRSYNAIFILFLKERGDRGKPSNYFIHVLWRAKNQMFEQFAQRAAVSYNKLKYVSITLQYVRCFWTCSKMLDCLFNMLDEIYHV